MPSLSVLTGQRFINVLWVSLKSYPYNFGKFDLKIVQMFTLQWRCFIGNLISFLNSFEKVIATQLLNYDRNWKLLNIQKRELTSSICKALRVHGVHRNVTQYSPVQLTTPRRVSWHRACQKQSP